MICYAVNKVHRVVTRVRGSGVWREEEEEDNNEGAHVHPGSTSTLLSTTVVLPICILYIPFEFKS